MQSQPTLNQPSLCAILHALILALIPFVDSLLAQAAREGRRPSPALRSLARTLAGLRAFARILGISHPTPVPSPTSSPRRARTLRRHTPQPPRESIRSRHPGVIPEPVRTLEL